jgi:hypothetical protein
VHARRDTGLRRRLHRVELHDLADGDVEVGADLPRRLRRVALLVHERDAEPEPQLLDAGAVLTAEQEVAARGKRCARIACVEAVAREQAVADRR